MQIPHTRQFSSGQTLEQECKENQPGIYPRRNTSLDLTTAFTCPLFTPSVDVTQHQEFMELEKAYC